MQKRLSSPRFAIGDLWARSKLHPCSKCSGTFLKSDMMVILSCHRPREEEEKPRKSEINITVYFGWTEFLDEAMFQKLFHDLEIWNAGLANVTFNVQPSVKLLR